VSVTQKQSLTIFLIIVLIGIIVSFVLSQVFVRPIMKLTENVKKISLGNLHVKTDVKANDEIGELATAFNKMASDLNLNIESLESKNKELEMFAIALRESEEKYRTLIENSSDAVLIIDTNGYFSLVNKKFCEISGYSLEEVEGTHFSKLVHPEDLNLVMERNIKRLKGDNDIPNNYEFRIIGKKGEVKYIDFSVSSIKKGNEIVGIQGTARDITDRKKLEEQLLQSQKMESIGRLSGGIAHDFNNLLAAILPNAELIKMQTPPATMLYQCADAIKQAAERASELVKQFLSFSRQGKYKLVTFNPNKLIKETIKLLERTIGKDINIETDLEENLSGIDADETQIEQIILNLAVNARDAMPNGGKIVFSTRNVYLDENFCKTRVDLKPGYYVCISVRDTGTGIKKEFMDKIFDPFFTTKEVSKGTGLGLSVVYGIVKNHNGHVGVYSEVGKGTEFKIYLPVSEKAEVVEKPRQEEVIAGVGNETILVVDDEPVVLDVASSILKTLDYKVMVARDGLEAVEIYQSKYESIDLILLDMMMPRLDGRETFKRLKEINPKVRVLLSSGYSQDDRIQQALKEGVAGFIRKPYSIAELSKSVREVLKH
jgi:PAS domain S-box-containing protein